MITSMEVLTAENDLYRREQKEWKNYEKRNNEQKTDVKQNICRNKIHDDCQEGRRTQEENIYRNKEVKIKKKILILGDSNSTDLTKILNNLQPNKYLVQAFIKHNAELEDIIVDIRNLTESFTLTDHVIIAAGLTNAMRGKVKLMKRIIEMIDRSGGIKENSPSNKIGNESVYETALEKKTSNIECTNVRPSQAESDNNTENSTVIHDDSFLETTDVRKHPV
ncbi:hypothetical protein JTB14_034694 [Gonioctena quinquepunctata]|nr:hypothetical protein JTB14_034694 [Gonioctena quinquepunctata]